MSNTNNTNEEIVIENEKGDLMAIMQKIQRQSERKHDLVAPTNLLQVQTDKAEDGSNRTNLIIEANKGEPTQVFEANDLAFEQIAEKTKIDIRTARRLRDHYPAELDTVFQAIFEKENRSMFLRTFTDDANEPGGVYRRDNFGINNTGVLRAFMSDRYKPLDNVDLCEVALPQLMESDARWQIVKGTITDRRLYLSLRSTVITQDVLERVANPATDMHSRGAWNGTETREIDGVHRATGDLMSLAITISNSEVGAGSLNVTQGGYTLACLNLMQTSHTFRKTHLGSSLAAGDDFVKALQQDTKDAMFRAVALQLRDTIADMSKPEALDAIVQAFADAHGRVINVGPQQAVDNLGEVLKLTKPERSLVLDGLMNTIGQAGYAGRPISQATLANAVTAVGNNPEIGGDDQFEWSKIGGKVIDLSERDWNVVATREAA